MGLPCGSTLDPPPIRCRNLLREISKATLPFYHGLDNAYKGVLTQIFRYAIKNKAIFTLINHCHNKNLNLLKSHQLSFQWRSILIPNSPLKCVNFLPSMLHCTYHVASIEITKTPTTGTSRGLFLRYAGASFRFYFPYQLPVIQPTELNGPLSRCPRKRTARSTRSKPSSISRHIFPSLG